MSPLSEEVWVVESCPCGNDDPTNWIKVGYREWSRANGVPMTPVMLLCGSCMTPARVKRIEHEGVSS